MTDTETTRWTTHHMCVDIRGALLNMSRRELAGFFRHDDGRRMTADEARLALMDELAKGRRVLPVGGPCEGFDYQTGCPGHAAEGPADAR